MATEPESERLAVFNKTIARLNEDFDRATKDILERIRARKMKELKGKIEF